MIVKSSFLPRLTAKGKEFCKLGHELELPFARKLLQHSKEGLTIFDVEKIYRVSLVGKMNEMYVKALCDFVASAVIDGEKQLVGVECKASRVTPGTHQRERAHTEFLSRFINTLSLSLVSPRVILRLLLLLVLLQLPQVLLPLVCYRWDSRY